MVPSPQEPDAVRDVVASSQEAMVESSTMETAQLAVVELDKVVVVDSALEEEEVAKLKLRMLFDANLSFSLVEVI